MTELISPEIDIVLEGHTYHIEGNFKLLKRLTQHLNQDIAVITQESISYNSEKMALIIKIMADTEDDILSIEESIFNRYGFDSGMDSLRFEIFSFLRLSITAPEFREVRKKELSKAREVIQGLVQAQDKANSLGATTKGSA